MTDKTFWIYGYNHPTEGAMFQENVSIRVNKDLQTQVYDRVHITGKQEYLETWKSEHDERIALAEKAFNEMPLFYHGNDDDEERIIGGVSTKWFNVLEIPGVDPSIAGMQYYEKRETHSHCLAIVWNNYRAVRFADGTKIEQRIDVAEAR